MLSAVRQNDPDQRLNFTECEFDGLDAGEWLYVRINAGIGDK